MMLKNQEYLSIGKKKPGLLTNYIAVTNNAIDTLSKVVLIEENKELGKTRKRNFILSILALGLSLVSIIYTIVWNLLD